MRSWSHTRNIFPAAFQQQELYGAHTPCAALQLHTARVLCMDMFLSYLYIYMHRGYTFFFAGGKRKVLALLILQPLCVFYLVTLLISSFILLSIARVHLSASVQNMHNCCGCDLLILMNSHACAYANNCCGCD